MLGLLIANLVISSLLLAAVIAAGIRIAVVSVRAKAQARRPKVDPELVGKLASALVQAAAKKKPAPEQGHGSANVTDLKREKEA